MYILVVEDDASARMALIRLLEGLGHRTCFAASGERALQHMRIEKPDLVLLDMVLEGSTMSGWDVAREKLLDPDIRAIPCVIVTGLAPDDVRDRANVVASALSGTMLIVPKPVNIDVLRRIIDMVGEGKGPGRDGEPT